MAFDYNDPNLQKFMKDEENKNKNANKKSSKSSSNDNGVDNDLSQYDLDVFDYVNGYYELLPEGKKQKRIFKKKRAKVKLLKEDVKNIKEGRKLLKQQLKDEKKYSKKRFKRECSNYGLYFDRGWLLAILGRLGKKWLWWLLATLLALIIILFVLSAVTKMRGHFTVNLNEEMSKEGFELSETEDFKLTATQLFCEAAEDIPELSIIRIPPDVDEYEGEHHGRYFAYTCFVRNVGDNPQDYDWNLNIISENHELSECVWVMLFEDGEMSFYADPNKQTGLQEALPSFDDNSRGYINLPLMNLTKHPEDQYEVIKNVRGLSYYRIIPYSFLTDTNVATGEQLDVKPYDVHKYTVVMWLEGDDPECVDEKIDGWLGLELDFKIRHGDEDTEKGETPTLFSGCSGFMDSLKFWDKD